MVVTISNGGFPMKCHYCGTELTGKEIFCRYCGTRQVSAPQAEPVVEPAPVYEAPPAPAPVYEAPSQPAPVQEEVSPAPVPEAVPAPAPAATVYEEKTFNYQPYGGAPREEPLFDFEKAPAARRPALQLPVKRGLAKMFFFSILTLGIYPMVIYSRLVTERNIVASRHDGRRTLSFFGMLMLAPLTLGILPLVWSHNLCSRIGGELQRRNINYNFGAKDFWLWNFLLIMLASVAVSVAVALQAAMMRPSYWIIGILVALALLCSIGPLVFVHKLMESMNLINDDYNRFG